LLRGSWGWKIRRQESGLSRTGEPSERSYCNSKNGRVFTNARGEKLSADGVQYIVAKHAKSAKMMCPTLAKKRVTPHVLRHTAAMELLQAGVDRTVIALWLGHESMETTQVYLDADLAMREKALAKLEPMGKPPRRYKADDALLAFLKSL
jgi:integrase/recombinase XerD